MRAQLVCGKIDAGVAVLLTEDKRLIEFPSILLPPDIHSGSIVDVDVSRNFKQEKENDRAFTALQNTILQEFGASEPTAPSLRCRNATQTSVVLEWDPLDLATAKLRSFSLYRNGSKAGSIPRPMEMTSTKISGLAVDTEYNFQLVLRTSAGTYSSEKLVVRTHKMTNLTGITITPGVMPPQLRESLESTVERIGAKLIEQVRIDTTHFVCTEEKGEAFKKAQDMNIPVVVPDWVKGCERDGRIVGVRAYYIGADPKLRQVGPGANLIRQDSNASSTLQGNQSQVTSTPTTQVTPPTPDRRRAEERDEDEEKEDGRESDSRGDGASALSERDGALHSRDAGEDKQESSSEDEEEDEKGGTGENASPQPQASSANVGNSALNEQAREAMEEAMEDVKL